MTATKWHLTPLGFLELALAKELGGKYKDYRKQAKAACEALAQYMRQHYATDGNAAIVLLDDGSMTFTTVCREKEPAE